MNPTCGVNNGAVGNVDGTQGSPVVPPVSQHTDITENGEARTDGIPED